MKDNTAVWASKSTHEDNVKITVNGDWQLLSKAEAIALMVSLVKLLIR